MSRIKAADEIERYSWIKVTRPIIFRRKCIKCHDLIRNELMFKTSKACGPHSAYTQSDYYCTVCFKTKAEVAEYLWKKL